VKSALIITSIAAPNPVLRACAAGCREQGFDFIVIGDTKSPSDFSLEGCDFWGLERQQQLPYPLARLLPENHYARKNLGYLLAMERGAEVIIETDDDNLPLADFWDKRSATRQGYRHSGCGWLNPLRHFSDEPVWPRGFPLELVQQTPPDLDPCSLAEHYCPIQQGLVDGDPDLDAVYRLTRPLPLTFGKNLPLALGPGCWAPFNSQNTTWFREAFLLLYLPSFCSFRITDIWRSFVAQRICHANGWNTLFHSPTAVQERNPHDLLKDFADEVPGYLYNAEICRKLSELHLRPGPDCLAESMLVCYEIFIQMGLIGADELTLLEAWIATAGDLHCGSKRAATAVQAGK